MNRNEAQTFAHQWAAAWNERDVEHVLEHFHENVTFISPTAQAVVGAGTVHGKAALRAYWNTALGRLTSLHFTVDRVIWDPASRELAILYTRETNGSTKRASENLTFDADGLVISAEVFHGVTG